jgi:copper resistance protein B
MRAARRGARALIAAATLAFGICAPAQAQQADAAGEHVPPPAPAQPMPAMSDQEMDRVMDMHDDPLLAMFKLDQFERARGDDTWATDWEAEAWIGRDFDKLWLRTEGEREGGRTDARVEAFWDHAFASFWDWQLGVRHDAGGGARRDWAAFGVQGLAPYWFEIEATAYAGDSGRTALRFRAEYELLFTQRLILQPEFETNLYGKRDVERGIDSGVNDAALGLRLRYEIRREIAPYIGVVWKHRANDTTAAPQLPVNNMQWVAGLRVWF